MARHSILMAIYPHRHDIDGVNGKQDDPDAHILKLWKSSDSALRLTLNNEQELQVRRTALACYANGFCHPLVFHKCRHKRTEDCIRVRERERERRSWSRPMLNCLMKWHSRLKLESNK